MRLRIIDEGGPIFRQIADQIRHRILSGALAAGSELPTIRALAESIAVNPNTVARAYRELEHAELIEKRRTTGTFVRDDVQTQSIAARRRQLHDVVDALIAQATGLGFEIDDVCDLLQQRARRSGGSSK